jgi:hypothetical protein
VINLVIPLPPIVAPSLTTQNRLTTNLATAFGIESSILANAKPVIKAKQDTNNAPKTIDDTPSISGNNLVIAEGATGFATGDQFFVELYVGCGSATATASTV